MINLKQYAEENDLNFIGEKQVEIQTPLLDEEKIDLGKNQSEKLNMIKNLKENLAETQKQIKAKITEAEGVEMFSNAVCGRKNKATSFERT